MLLVVNHVLFSCDLTCIHEKAPLTHPSWYCLLKKCLIIFMVFYFPGTLQKNFNIEGVHLIMAGGYDERVAENREHYEELKNLCDNLSLNDHVTFVRSFSDAQKRTLLANAQCLIYTPDREHFGIVPIEAMYLGCPVIAVASGGPLETVADGETGYLCDPTPEKFAVAMKKLVEDKSLSKKLGSAGRKRVIQKFSFQSFTSQLNSIIERLCEN